MHSQTETQTCRPTPRTKNTNIETEKVITVTVIYEHFTRLSQPMCQHDIHMYTKGRDALSEQLNS